jgi:hypothetical protein
MPPDLLQRRHTCRSPSSGGAVPIFSPLIKLSRIEGHFGGLDLVGHLAGGEEIAGEHPLPCLVSLSGGARLSARDSLPHAMLGPRVGRWPSSAIGPAQ